MNKDDVLKVAAESGFCVEDDGSINDGVETAADFSEELECFAAAMYAAGAEAEREVSDKLVAALQIAVSTCFTEYAHHKYMSDPESPIRALLSEVAAIRAKQK